MSAGVVVDGERTAPALRRVDRPRGASPIVIAVVVAWLAVVGAGVSGVGVHFHHDSLIEHGSLPLPLALLLFLVAWQLMIAAMMVPSSLPLLRLFERVSSTQPSPHAARSAFIGGYALVWTIFAAVAFVGDAALHHLVDTTPWLVSRPWLISGGLLGVAGIVQFTPLTTNCLRECRHPVAYVMQRYRPGVNEAFRLGRNHGFYCLGCCWGLMLVMFGAGVASLAWMAGLTAVMVYEKVGRHGAALAPVTGVVLLGWALLVIAHPSWLPHTFAGVS